jgi:hypothetical protein
MPLPLTAGNDSFTKLLLHCDGANGSTTITDSSLAAHGNASVFSGAAIAQPNGVFNNAGALSLLTSSYITFPNSADWEFSNGDFTIDWWEYRINGGDNQPVASRDATTTYVPWAFWAASGYIQFYSSASGAAWDNINGFNVGVITTGAWTHWAVTKSGTTVRAFKNGTLTNTVTASGTMVANSNPLSIGRALASNYFYGYIDEFRISKGIARWTANFTPPTAPYG